MHLLKAGFVFRVSTEKARKKEFMYLFDFSLSEKKLKVDVLPQAIKYFDISSLWIVFL